MNDIRRFVRSVHLTIYARNDEDIEIAVILSQLAKIGSAVDDPPKSVAVNGPSALVGCELFLNALNLSLIQFIKKVWQEKTYILFVS